MKQHFDILEKQSQFIQIVSTNQNDPNEAIYTLAQDLDQTALAFILLFIPENADLKNLESAVNTHLTQSVLFGVSSAGQITVNGYEDDAYLAIGFTKKHFRFASLIIDPLNPFSLSKIGEDIEKLSFRFPHTAGWNRLGLVFPDGLSKQEDVLIAALAATLPELPIYGGSAAENTSTSNTQIFANHRFQSNVALFLIIETDLDFRLINFDHFTPNHQKMVVTKANPLQRILQELNGAPAAQEYAEMIGIPENELSPEYFAQNPFLIKIGQEYHVRSIQKRTEDGGLELLCSLDEGLILTLGKAGEIVRRMEKELDQARVDNESPSFILAFDCFLRRLEIEGTQRLDRASRVLRDHAVVGFNTFGEQHSGIHVNHTFVGVAFYAPSKPVLL